MTLDEVVAELTYFVERAEILADVVKPMARLDIPDDRINLAWNALGGVGSAAGAARGHILIAMREILGE